MGLRTTILPLALAALVGANILSGPFGTEASAHATKPMPRVTVTGKVLLGDAKSFRKVAVVHRRTVFEALPPIKTLRAEKVPKDSARYHFLVYEANRSFNRALLKAAAQLKVDLVVDAGGVSAAGIDVVDLTALTLEVVRREP